MSKVTFKATGHLTAFHASRAGGIVICIEAASLDGLDLDEVNRVAPSMLAVVTVEAEDDPAPTNGEGSR